MILLIIALLPVYLIGLYIYKKDRDKESRKLLTKLFFKGCLSCIPAIILELVIGAFFGPEENMDTITLFIYVFISIALAEEICKWYYMYKTAYNHEEFDHIYDAIVYCSFVALGFASVENIFYIMADGGIRVGLLRAVTAIPGHVSFAVIMACYIGSAKIAQANHNHSKEKRNLVLSIVVPSIVHALYDYFIFIDDDLYILAFFALVIFIFIFSYKKIKKLSKVEDNIVNKPKETITTTKTIDTVPNTNINYCPNCGAKIYGKYCQNCGHDLSNYSANNLTQ